MSKRAVNHAPPRLRVTLHMYGGVWDVTFFTPEETNHFRYATSRKDCETLWRHMMARNAIATRQRPNFQMLAPPAAAPTAETVQ